MSEKPSWHADAEQIAKLVNMTELFHKYVQLNGSPLQLSILNESRYLARALSEVLSLVATADNIQNASHNKKIDEAIGRAKLAASSSLNDIIDTILEVTVMAIVAIEKKLRKGDFEAYIFEYLDEENLKRYKNYLNAYRNLSEKVAVSRSNRERRVDIYLAILEDFFNNSNSKHTSDLTVVVDFYRRLREFEIVVITNFNNSKSSAGN